MSNKITRLHGVFGATACNTAIICSTEARDDLRLLTDRAVDFARSCRILFRESANNGLHGDVRKIEDISAAYKPETLAPFSLCEDWQLPLPVARQIMDGAPLIRNMARAVRLTRDGAQTLSAMDSWQAYQAQARTAMPSVLGVKGALDAIDRAPDSAQGRMETFRRNMERNPLVFA